MISAATCVVVSGSAERISMNEGVDRRCAASRVPKSVSCETITRSSVPRPFEDRLVARVLQTEVTYGHRIVTGFVEQPRDDR